jgi:hypothetical protein
MKSIDIKIRDEEIDRGIERSIGDREIEIEI